MIKHSLSGSGWKMRECGSGKSYDVSAPCSVLSVLTAEGVIQDPYYRENEKTVLPLLEKDYEFERSINVNGELMREDSIELVFYGLDTVTEIFLNGERLGRTKNMHRTYRFSVKDKFKMGENRLKIVFHSALKTVRDQVPTPGKEIHVCAAGALPGGQYIRKAHSSFGWDWGPQLPDMGIFRDIELEAFSKVRLHEVRFFQEYDQGEVRLYVDPVLEYTDTYPIEICVSVSGEQPVSFMTRLPDSFRQFSLPREYEVCIPIHNPQLWWPNGLGDQPLYDVTITLRKTQMIYEEKHYRIGLRTLKVSREKDEFGEEFCFVVNGVKIFAMGANYIPEDAIYPRIDREKISALIDAAKRANFNCLRVWGGGYYPSDDFYDLCDEAGIIVWQDLMYACNVYDLTPGLEKSIVAETRDNVRRLRHHASLGLWCGNNEIESAWAGWGDFQKEAMSLRADYIKMFEYILPRAVAEEDDLTFYWPSSPSSGGCMDKPDDENRGDAHYWDVWHGQKPFTDYKEHYFRFLSEFGFQSFPGIKTIKRFTEPEDRNIFSPVMENHQKNGWANGKILYYMSENFRYPKNFEQLLYVSQILQGMAIRCGVEHFRRNHGRCMGTLYWQLNDNWPVASWSSVDYYGRWKALHYMAKRFYAPVSGSILLDGMTATPYVVNDGMADVSVKVRFCLMDMEGKVLQRYTEDARCPAGEAHHFLKRDFGRYVDSKHVRDVVVIAEYEYGERIFRESAVFAPYKHLNLRNSTPEVAVTKNGDIYEIHLEAENYTPFVMLELREADAIFSDNVFDLIKGMPVTVYVHKDDIHGMEIANAEMLKDQLVIYTLQGSYE